MCGTSNHGDVSPRRWNTYVVDGHDVEELCKAFWQAKQVKDKPTCIVAKTFKGKGLKSRPHGTHGGPS